MQKVLVPLVAALCLGFLGFVFYLFMQDDKKPKQPIVQANQNQQPQRPAPRQQQPGPKVGDKAPEIAGQDVDGKEFKLSDYRGKVVVLDFWGFW
jgi:cytochrome oxidase Cu insertion factor (SCO1/SenC/PrrC family)